ncbi:hypothetical protein DVH05_007084 [Phytophthora capsici]|nr:hypothetical protein DVH05_007084 [Phytophthora capsici]
MKVLRAVTRSTIHKAKQYVKTVLAFTHQAYSISGFLPSQTKLVPRGSRPPPPPLPQPNYFEIENHCKIEYVDIQPDQNTDQSVSIVLLHGAPGCYQDFRYLIPLVQRPGVRILGINLPGYEGSTVSKTHYLESISAFPAAKLAFDALKSLTSPTEHIFLVGHSFGAQTAINMASLNVAESRMNIRGMGLLAPVGCSPHHVMSPRANAIVIKMLGSGNPFIVSLASHAVKAIYTKLLRFPADWPAGPFVLLL